MRISIVVAMTLNRCIGKNGTLPWHLPNDLKYFKQLTTGHCIIMGRKTFEAIGKVLPQRINIVVSQQPDYQIENAFVVPTLEKAFSTAQAQQESECFVIGGGQIYAQALAQAHTIYLTLIKTEVAGDTFFPEFSLSEWQLVANQSFEIDAKHPWAYEFQVWERVGKLAMGLPKSKIDFYPPKTQNLRI
ncbi:MAG: dihydrofolate reductase [Microscillaceae bacterium]|nr:dihydrofolate reductase [Microscillaceae bacterium]MDW8459667.1 dihydrofolate reductase [Cytophagales bacterium]